MHIVIPDELAEQYNDVYLHACRALRRVERVLTLPHWSESARTHLVDELRTFARQTRLRLIRLDITARRDAAWTHRLHALRPQLNHTVNRIRRLLPLIDSIPIREPSPSADLSWS